MEDELTRTLKNIESYLINNRLPTYLLAYQFAHYLILPVPGGTYLVYVRKIKHSPGKSALEETYGTVSNSLLILNDFIKETNLMLQFYPYCHPDLKYLCKPYCAFGFGSIVGFVQTSGQYNTYNFVITKNEVYDPVTFLFDYSIQIYIVDFTIIHNDLIEFTDSYDLITFPIQFDDLVLLSDNYEIRERGLDCTIVQSDFINIFDNYNLEYELPHKEYQSDIIQLISYAFNNLYPSIVDKIEFYDTYQISIE